MRKIFGLVCAILFVASYGFARDYATKGILEIGGEIGYSATSGEFESDGTKVLELAETNIKLAPEVGYFVADNILLSLVLDIDNTETETTVTGSPASTDKEKNTRLSIAPGYVLPQEGFYPYGGLLLGVMSSKNDEELSLTDYGLRLGVRVPIAESGLVDIGLWYLMSSGDIKTSGYPDIDVTMNALSLGVGVVLYR